MAVLPCSCSRNSGNKNTATNLFEQGMRQFDADSLVEAFNSFLMAKTLAAENNSPNDEFEASVYLALLYEYMGHSDSAYLQLKRLPYIEIEDSNPNIQERHYSNQYYWRLMGLYSYKIDNNCEQALQFYDKAIDLSTRLYPNDTIFVYTDLANKADILRAQGNHKQAWEIIDFLENAPLLQYGMYRSQAHYVRGWLLYEQGDLDGAYQAWEEDEKYCELNNMYENQIVELSMLAHIDSLRRDIDNYFVHNSRYHQLYQQLRGTETNYHIAMVQEQNKLFLERQAHLRQRTIFWLSAALLCIVILALLGLIYYLRKSAQTRHRLASLEKEQLDSKIERQRLEHELMELRMRQSQEELDRANKDNIALSLQIAEMPEDGERDKYLQAFEQQLRKTESALFRTLMERYPQLTQNDLRLIGMLQLGMTAQEIRSLLNITPDSLKKNRYRLRKKLGLATEQNLEEFFKSIKSTSN